MVTFLECMGCSKRLSTLATWLCFLLLWASCVARWDMWAPRFSCARSTPLSRLTESLLCTGKVESREFGLNCMCKNDVRC